MYTSDQWAVMTTLSSDAPKRPKLRVADIATRSFGDSGTGDRRARNAFRKLRAQGHVEIAERGKYRATSLGLSYFKKAVKYGSEPRATRAPRKATTKDTKKAAPKKVAKKAAPKKLAKKATAKKTAAKKSTRKVPSPPKKAKTSNGVRRTKAAGPVTLSF